MKSHLTFFILLHIRTTESVIKHLASFLHERKASKISMSAQMSPKEKHGKETLTSNSSPSSSATCPRVLYLSQSASLANQTVHSSLSSPSGIAKSGPSPAINNFKGEWLTWSRKTWRHFSCRNRGSESGKSRVWVWRDFSHFVGMEEEAGEL